MIWVIVACLLTGVLCLALLVDHGMEMRQHFEDNGVKMRSLRLRLDAYGKQVQQTLVAVGIQPPPIPEAQEATEIIEEEEEADGEKEEGVLSPYPNTRRPSRYSAVLELRSREAARARRR